MKKFAIYLISTVCLLAAVPVAWVAAGDSVTLAPPLKTAGANLQTIVANVLSVALGSIGIIALVAFIWAGFTWMIASGDASKIAKAKKIMIWAVAGFVIIFASYAILILIFNALGYPTPGVKAK